MGRISAADKPAWWNLCMRWQRIMEAEEAINKHGIVVAGRSGELKRNPAAATLKAEQEAFRRERAIFGLDPEARAQLGFKFASPQDAYQRYKDKKAGKKSMEDLIDSPGDSGIWVD
jgi:P27 family predicted phage terminase small subunit